MTFDASWVHGNALTVESPEALDWVGHFGWGADMGVKPGKASWFHIALPTPVVVGDSQTKLERVFIMFSTTSGQIRSVHLYDGSINFHQFNDLHAGGEHRTSIGTQDTFTLPTPHAAFLGIGVSILFQADIGFDSNIPAPRLIVAASGADYRN
jgi:hypothetical protein